jgi:hypothetical protein
MHNASGAAKCSRILRPTAPLKFRTAAGAAGGHWIFPYTSTDTDPDRAKNLFMKKRIRCM